MSPPKLSQGVDTHAHVFSANAPAAPGARFRPAYAAAGSGIDLVLDHFGNPGVDPGAIDATFDAVGALAASRKVWRKLSAPYRLGGADRRLHQDLARWVGRELCAAILWDNAARLYRFH
jgi:predicted TIM-barrel fold metal-dependent hydrolase